MERAPDREHDELVLAYGYSLYCAGVSTDEIEQFMPVSGQQLEKLITKLKALEAQNFKKKISIKVGWVNVTLKFRGVNPGKGLIKVRSSLRRLFSFF